VRIFTAHHDKAHCFEETRDGTIDVVCVGDWMPNSVLGIGRAVCAYARMIYVALYLVLASGLKPDVIFCDQVSACIPFVRMFSAARVIFYCHFPDQLLTQRKSFAKKMYRWPIDW
jgi:alpha-1,3/alpha-1,6-mannosyltransferase